MRGYNIAVPGIVGFVDWVVNDVPDSAAALIPSPYLASNIINITINKVVTSKVDNFIKNGDPSFVSEAYNNPQDGYLLHLNSYDWLNPDGPVSLPPMGQPVGVAVVRGTASSSSPFTPLPYASMFWEESSSAWHFADIMNDGSIGMPLPVNVGDLSVSGGLNIENYLSVGSLSSTTGIIRIPNATDIAARNQEDTEDLNLIGTDVIDRIRYGYNTLNGGHVFYTGSGNAFDFQIGNLSQFNISKGSSGPVITQYHSTATSFTGNTFTVQAQGVSGASSTGGDLTLSSGYGTVGNGKVNIGIGSDYDGGTTNILSIYPDSLTFNAAVSNPVINQANSADGYGFSLTIQAQNAVSFGGNLLLSSGSGTTTGSVIIETGGVPQILVTPTTTVIGSGINYNTIIAGNLMVDGYTTTVESTTVDIVGRVIHANFSTGIMPPIYPPPFPTDLDGYVTGLSIHRGSSTGAVPRDSAGLFYTELSDVYVDGYWKLATLAQDNDLLPASIGLVETIPLMAAALIATADPNQELFSGTIPTVGGLRTLNNTVAVASRTADTNHDLLLLGTDGYNDVYYGNDNYTNSHTFYVLGTAQASMVHNKFVLNQGFRRHVTNHGSTQDGASYTIQASDDYIALTTLTGVFSFLLPLSPITGDTYQIKDVNGLGTSHVVTINGNGNNIDGSATINTGYTNTNYFHIILTFTGSEWSIS
jgi:hypothetical protein